jgi:hypothetical protein
MADAIGKKEEAVDRVRELSLQIEKLQREISYFNSTGIRYICI